MADQGAGGRLMAWVPAATRDAATYCGEYGWRFVRAASAHADLPGLPVFATPADDAATWLHRDASSILADSSCES